MVHRKIFKITMNKYRPLKGREHKSDTLLDYSDDNCDQIKAARWRYLQDNGLDPNEIASRENDLTPLREEFRKKIDAADELAELVQNLYF